MFELVRLLPCSIHRYIATGLISLNVTDDFNCFAPCYYCMIFCTVNMREFRFVQMKYSFVSPLLMLDQLTGKGSIFTWPILGFTFSTTQQCQQLLAVLFSRLVSNTDNSTNYSLAKVQRGHSALDIVHQTATSTVPVTTTSYTTPLQWIQHQSQDNLLWLWPRGPPGNPLSITWKPCRGLGRATQSHSSYRCHW